MTTQPTRYKRLDITDVQTFLETHGLAWDNMGVAPYDTTLAVVKLRDLPEKGRNGVVIKNYAGWVSNQLEGWGAIQTRYDVPDNRTYFKLIEDDTVDA